MKAVKSLIFGLLFMSVYQLNAQLCVPPSGYNINNNNSKTVLVVWEIVDVNCSTVSQGSASIGPSGSVNIPLTSFTGANDIYVVMLSIANSGTCNNNSVYGTVNPTCNNSTTNLTETGFEYGSPSCSSGGAPWTMNWFCDHVDIN